MTFWQMLDRWDQRRAKLSERQWVTIAVIVLLFYLLRMAQHDKSLWDVEVFKVIIQAVALTGVLNMILAFHFAANKGDDIKAENTGKAFDALHATANAATATAQAAQAATDASATGKADDPVHIADDAK
jgi:hypothetical protein